MWTPWRKFGIGGLLIADTSPIITAIVMCLAILKFHNARPVLACRLTQLLCGASKHVKDICTCERD